MVLAHSECIWVVYLPIFLNVNQLPIPPINEPSLVSSLSPLSSIIVYSLSSWLFLAFLFGILNDPDSKSTEKMEAASGRTTDGGAAGDSL